MDSMTRDPRPTCLPWVQLFFRTLALGATNTAVIIAIYASIHVHRTWGMVFAAVSPNSTLSRSPYVEQLEFDHVYTVCMDSRARYDRCGRTAHESKPQPHLPSNMDSSRRPHPARVDHFGHYSGGDFYADV